MPHESSKQRVHDHAHSRQQTNTGARREDLHGSESLLGHHRLVQQLQARLQQTSAQCQAKARETKCRTHFTQTATATASKFDRRHQI